MKYFYTWISAIVVSATLLIMVTNSSDLQKLSAEKWPCPIIYNDHYSLQVCRLSVVAGSTVIDIEQMRREYNLGNYELEQARKYGFYNFEKIKSFNLFPPEIVITEYSSQFINSHFVIEKLRERKDSKMYLIVLSIFLFLSTVAIVRWKF